MGRHTVKSFRWQELGQRLIEFSFVPPLTCFGTWQCTALFAHNSSWCIIKRARAIKSDTHEIFLPSYLSPRLQVSCTHSLMSKSKSRSPNHISLRPGWARLVLNLTFVNSSNTWRRFFAMDLPLHCSILEELTDEATDSSSFLCAGWDLWAALFRTALIWEAIFIESSLRATSEDGVWTPSLLLIFLPFIICQRSCCKFVRTQSEPRSRINKNFVVYYSSKYPEKYY